MLAACAWLGGLLLAGACGDRAAPGGAATASDGLVFVRDVDGSPEIRRARLADGAERPVTETPDRVESWPYWSDAAGRLLYQVAGPDGRNDLVLFDPRDGRESPLVATPERDEHWQTWSPDGARVAFAYRGRGGSGVEVVRVADGERRPLARAGSDDFFLRPAFAPDGATLVCQRRVKPRDAKLWLLAESAAPRPLTRDAAWSDMKAWFTRDGRHVVYSRRPAGSGPHDVAVIDRDGSGRRLVASEAEADDHSARPSPTRDEVAFVSDRGGSFDLYLAGLDGGDVRRLTATGERDEFAPRWSPDGERIVVTTAPRPAPGQRAGGRAAFADARVRVLDRGGDVLFETDGMMPDWMPPWP